MTALVVQGDARQLPLPDATVDLIVTSPPYFGLRSYTDGGEHYAGQIGSEATPTEFVDALIDCTREWMRVLKPSGSIFVNLGDKYSAARRGPDGSSSGLTNGAQHRPASQVRYDVRAKSLCGLPWRYALRCIDDLGLILRAEIVWSKPNGLPESVTDRVRRSHEQWFHFTVNERYYSAMDELREPHLHKANGAIIGGQKSVGAGIARYGETYYDALHPLGKLPGSVWEVPSQPLTVPAHLGVDHFAAFPTEWPRRLILGWSPSGYCTACGEARRPTIGSVGLDASRPQARRAQQLADSGGLTEEHFAALLSVGVSDVGRGAATQSGTGKNTAAVYALAAEARAALGGYAREYLLRRPTSLISACGCESQTAPTTPAVVLDPFGGTGTTALVASTLGRVGVTVDRSLDYCRLAQWRTTDPGERARAMRVAKPPKQASGQLDLLTATAEEAG